MEKGCAVEIEASSVNAPLVAGNEDTNSKYECFDDGDYNARDVPIEGDLVLLVYCFVREQEVTLAEFGSVGVSGTIVCGDGPLMAVVNTRGDVLVQRIQKEPEGRRFGWLD